MAEKVLNLFHFVAIVLAGWLNQRQQNVSSIFAIESCASNSESVAGSSRLTSTPFSGEGLGRKLLAQVATLVTPDTLLAWHRKLMHRSTMAVRGGNLLDPSPRTT